MSNRMFGAVERIIQEGHARGEFDDLPGSGKPLPNGGNQYDPNWWVKGFIEREDLDKSALLPMAVRLRREAEAFPEFLGSLETEDEVRAVLEDFNRRVRRERLYAVRDVEHRLLVSLVDVEEMVAAWRQERDTSRPHS